MAACKVARAPLPFVSMQPGLSRPFRPPGGAGCFTQGIGLRPQPWARISRPVGPVRDWRCGRCEPGGPRWIFSPDLSYIGRAGGPEGSRPWGAWM